MRLRAVAGNRVAAPHAVLVLLASALAVASCGGDDAASSDSGSGASGDTLSLTGAWMPAEGSLQFDANGSGYTWDPDAKPAGGIIVAENGGVYHVTLVGASGQRFAAGAAVAKDDLLLVRIGKTEPGVEFFLSSHGEDAAQMIAAVEGSPQPKAWVIDLAPGPVLEGAP